MIFLREFYDENHKVNTKNKWVWFVHAINYPYIFWVYFYTDAAERDGSTIRQMWIPLDIILTVLIVMYQIYYRTVERMEELAKGETNASLKMIPGNKH